MRAASCAGKVSTMQIFFKNTELFAAVWEQLLMRQRRACARTVSTRSSFIRLHFVQLFGSSFSCGSFVCRDDVCHNLCTGGQAEADPGMATKFYRILYMDNSEVFFV